jgi:formylglycine-generating enzyme required for sulfatase activity
MHGNVYEWCLDWYRKDFYEECLQQALVNNPLDASISNERILRGGSWWAGAKYCRSASRYGHTPEYSDSDTGFRLAFDC